MKYPRYLFLTYGTYKPLWWTTQGGDGEDDPIIMGCSPEDRAEVLEFSLAALHFPSLLENELESDPETVFLPLANERRKHSHDNYVELEFYHQCYDATLALALALNRTIEGKLTVDLSLPKSFMS